MLFGPLVSVHPVNEVAVLPVYSITVPPDVNRYPVVGKNVVSCTIILPPIVPEEELIATGF